MEQLNSTSPPQILDCTDETTCTTIDIHQTTKDSVDSGNDVDNEKGNEYDESQPPLSSGLPQKEDTDSNSMRKSSRTKKNNAKKKNETILQIHSEHDLDQLLLRSKSTFVLVEFVTTWCGACKSIQPLYEELAATTVSTPLLPNDNEEVDDYDDNDANDAERSFTCAQVICDKNKQTKKLALKYRVTSYPVFILFEFGGNQIDRWDGADRGKLMNVFDKLDRNNGKKTKKNKKKR